MLIEQLAGNSAFEPDDIEAMSMALEDACKALNVNGDAKAREVIAIRIIELARRGVRSTTMLRNRVVVEANGVAALRLAK